MFTTCLRSERKATECTAILYDAPYYQIPKCASSHQLLWILDALSTLQGGLLQAAENVLRCGNKVRIAWVLRLPWDHISHSSFPIYVFANQSIRECPPLSLEHLMTMMTWFGSYAETLSVEKSEIRSGKGERERERGDK